MAPRTPSLALLRGSDILQRVEGIPPAIATAIVQGQAQHGQALGLPGQGLRLHAGGWESGQPTQSSGLFVAGESEAAVRHVVGICPHLLFEIGDVWRALLFFAEPVRVGQARTLATHLGAQYSGVSVTVDPAPLPIGQQAADWLHVGGSGELFDAAKCLAEQGLAGSEQWRVTAEQRRSPVATVNWAERMTHAAASVKPIRLASDPDMARIVVAALGEPGNVASSDGSVCWLRDDGAWQRESPESLQQKIIQLDGRETSGGMVTLSQRRIELISRAVPDKAPKEEFTDRSPGVAFRDRLFVVKGQGLLDKKLEPQDHVMAEHVLPWPYLDQPHLYEDQSEVRELLLRAWADSEDAVALWQFFKEWLGLALLGMVIDFGKHIMLVGTSSQARRNIIYALEQCFPAGARSHLAPHEIGQRFKADRLRRARINISSELPTAQLKSTWRLKAVLSGMPIDAEAKSEQGYSLYSRAAHLFSGDEGFVTEDSELRSMLWTIPFELHRAGPEPGRKERLATEARLLTSLAVQAARDALARGRYIRPRATSEEALDWLQDSDPALVWIRANLEKDPEGFMSSSEIAQAINDAADNKLDPPMTLHKVAGRMRGRFRKTRVDSRRGWASKLKER